MGETMADTPRPVGRKLLTERLLEILKVDEPADAAARELLDQQRRVQRRIETVRDEVSRGVRARGDRFHL